MISISAGVCHSSSFGLDGPAGYAEVIVRDRGSGMDSPTLEKIFEPLFTTKRTGTGIGLAICHQVIVAHGGRIVAESVVGVGTAFHILLPASSVNRTQAIEPAMTVARRLLPASVLIVDDDRGVANALSEILALEHIRSSVACGGADAISAIERHDPDIVLLDIGLSDTDGVGVLEKILARWPGRRVIFMTGHDDRREIDALISLPHVGFLHKPFDATTLLDALADIWSVLSPELTLTSAK